VTEEHPGMLGLSFTVIPGLNLRSLFFKMDPEEDKPLEEVK